MQDYAPVHRLCTRLRNFLAGNFWPYGRSVGRCAETSVFVTMVLKETFAERPWRSIAGTFNKGYHCWTTDDKIIIDLTADQFDAVISPVLFVPVNDRRYNGDCTNSSAYKESQTYYNHWKLALRNAGIPVDHLVSDLNRIEFCQ
jgi:hypothetical protein